MRVCGPKYSRDPQARLDTCYQTKGKVLYCIKMGHFFTCMENVRQQRKRDRGPPKGRVWPHYFTMLPITYTFFHRHWNNTHYIYYRHRYEGADSSFTCYCKCTHGGSTRKCKAFNTKLDKFLSEQVGLLALFIRCHRHENLDSTECKLKAYPMIAKSEKSRPT